MIACETPHAAPAWREGDPVGERRFVDVGAIWLEFGGFLPSVTVAYETWGNLSNERDNAILVEHALTGDAHASGDVGPGQPTPGWWDDLIGSGKAIDTDRWFVVCANVLGGCQGTTGPSSDALDGQPWGSRWPRISIRDQVEVESRLAESLQIDQFASVIGGSMGGMRALEWAASFPDRVASAVLLASGAIATADQIATQTAQIHAITSDPAWNEGDYAEAGTTPVRGMGVARRFAHLTYRSEPELDGRFGPVAQSTESPTGALIPGRHPDAGRYAVQSYLDHHADKLAARFDPGTYVALSDAMSTHDVTRGRGDLASVLGSIEVPVWVGGVDSDRLYPLRLQQQIADLIPTARSLRVIASLHGHDGFLVETVAVGELIREALAY
jgi:homoserine O-acetyltransferase